MRSREKEKLLGQAAAMQREAECLIMKVIALRNEANALVLQASGPLSEVYQPLLAP